jgi:protoporphyrinogen oxidase
MPDSILEEYDYLIAGAGIAGLYTAYKLHKTIPSARICILEAGDYIGGRLHTLHYDGLMFDAGGARFNNEQRRILELVKELGLDKKQIPINSDIKYIPVNPKYDPTLATLFPTIDDFILDVQKLIRQNKISKNTLLNTTLADFAHTHYSKTHPTIKNYIISIYPYYSELAILNAIEGLHLFTNEFSTKVQYYILDGGLQQLPLEIYNHLKKSSNITIKLNTSLKQINDFKDLFSITTNTTNSIADTTETENSNSVSNSVIYRANKVILALPKSALSRINYIKRNAEVSKMINSIHTTPLYRIYARYPIDKETGKVWFADIPKVATNLPIKYIIPMDYEKGLIMISYTDAKYAKYWMNILADGDFEEELTKQLKQVFPDKNIPKPKWYKHCYWNAGAGYWKPGSSRINIMNKLIKPLDDKEIYICGENYSSHQAWVEGALETAEMVLQNITNNGTTKKTKKTMQTKQTKQTKIIQILNKKSKTLKKSANILEGGSTKEGKNIKLYTLEEVAKHNKKTDAWIVIDNIVADITEWIPKHPGGSIIMKGVGKDASKLFHSIGHDEIAKKMLNKYKIGKLAK